MNLKDYIEMLQKFLVDNEHLSEAEVCITQYGYYSDGIFADTFDLPELLKRPKHQFVVLGNSTQNY